MAEIPLSPLFSRGEQLPLKKGGNFFVFPHLWLKFPYNVAPQYCGAAKDGKM